MTGRPAATERILVGLLRLFGTTALLAVVLVAYGVVVAILLPGDPDVRPPR